MSYIDKIKRGVAPLLSLSFAGGLVGFGALILVVWLIGVDEYGRFAGALAVYFFLEAIMRAEIKVYILRFDISDDPSVYHSSFTLLFLSSMVIAIAGVLILLSINLPGEYEVFKLPLLSLLIFLPVSVSTEIPRAVLERKGEFSLIAKQEFLSITVSHVVSIFLILVLWDNWAALVAGKAVYIVLICILSFVASRYFPRINTDVRHLKSLFQYCKHLTVQNIMLQSKQLINPVLVGWFFGSTGVGIVSFSERIIHGLSFYRNALHRVAASVLGVTGKNNEKISRLLKEGMLLQVLPLGLLLLAGSVAVYFVSLYTDRQEWIWLNYFYPFLSAGFLFYVLFTIPGIALQMFDQNRELTSFRIVHTLLLFVLNILFLNYFGLVGYGLAVLASIPAYYMLIRSFRKQGVDLLTNEMIILIISIAIALHWYYIGWMAILSLAGLFLIPELINHYKTTWKEIRGYSLNEQ